MKLPVSAAAAVGVLIVAIIIALEIGVHAQSGFLIPFGPGMVKVANQCDWPKYRLVIETPAPIDLRPEHYDKTKQILPKTFTLSCVANDKGTDGAQITVFSKDPN